MAAICRRDRLDPFGALPGEILERVEAAQLVAALDDVGGDGPFVEAARALPWRCGGSSRASAGILTRSPSPGMRPCGMKRRAAPGSLAIFGPAREKSQAGRGVMTTPSSASSIAGWSSAAMSLVPYRLEKREPGIDGARYGGGMDALDGDLAEPSLLIPRGRRLHRRAAGAVERHGRAGLRRVEHEAVAADAGHVRLGDAQHRRGGERRVDGVAAGAQHVERGERRQWVRGGRHRLAGNRRRAAGLMKIAHGSLEVHRRRPVSQLDRGAYGTGRGSGQASARRREGAGEDGKRLVHGSRLPTVPRPLAKSMIEHCGDEE